MRPFLAVLAGYVLWSALWLAGNAAFQALWPEAYPADFPATPITALVAIVSPLVLSVLCSFAGGRLTAAIAPGRGAVWALALALLATGIAVQSTAWHALPLWYQLSFLGLLVPVTLLGGRPGRPSSRRIVGEPESA
jgi:hypothetical protein